MRFAYADPPYLDCCARYDHYHPDGRCWDDVDTHRALIGRLILDYPDGWCLSLSAPSLSTILPMCPPSARVAAWCKSWHQIRPRVPVQYAWEPVIYLGGRREPRNPMVRDYLVTPATRQRGTIGAKPESFARWIQALLGAHDGEIDDIYPGSGGMGRAWAQTSLPYGA